MIKKIDDDLTLYYKNKFPYKNRSKSLKKNRKKNRITIGIGGNIGNVFNRFYQLFLMIEKDSRFIIEKTSPILQNPPFGYIEQDDFFNAVMIVKTNLSPIEALCAFQRYEFLFKRQRSFQDAPRTLDIDMIFFNTINLDTPRLTIPHKGYKNRDSVLIPLSFVA